MGGTERKQNAQKLIVRNEQSVFRPVLGRGKTSRKGILRVVVDGVNHELNFDRAV